MLYDFFAHHVVGCRFGLGGQLVPELKVLVKLGPALGNSSRDQGKQGI